MPRIGQIHQHTPSLEVRDGRGVIVRQVACYRADAQQAVQRRVTLCRVDSNGQWRRLWDPRHSERSAAIAPGQQVLASLSGTVLLSESRDAGWQLLLPGDAGQAMESWDARGSHWQTDHDPQLRPLLIRESTAGQPLRLAECFTYSTVSGFNCRGRLVRHDDNAGTRLIHDYSLCGAERAGVRHFLQALDLPDWPLDVAERAALLEPGNGAGSSVRHGPLGEVLERIDALGNREHSRFDHSGQLSATSLELEDGSVHPLLNDTHYNAFGQIERQTFGNGLVTQAEYDPADGRLRRLSTSRPARSPLQDLHYGYDRVGNVIRIEDSSQPISHFANQRVDPVSTFSYDSLYQLREATGREAAGASLGPGLPDLAPDPGDTSRLLNFRQHYDYDASGNLLSLQHVGSQSYTRTLNVAEDSNHAVPAPGTPLGAFDANGNLLHLQPGQPLQWNARNQLHGTRQVVRENADDQEHYRYGGDGLRLRKVVTRLVAGRMQSSETRYLPGLELHTRPGEAFSVITTQAGRCTVRCLVWSEGQPDGIANPQLRYSLDDLHGSSGLELDSEARIISHEGYYPFGGTAWWAARSTLEAGYKTRRYSGQERDSSGLYAYGLRYYAPWLMRWINPDPAGDVDGLNRYRFVRNNPMTLSDHQGLNPEDQFFTLQRYSNAPRSSEPVTGLALGEGITLKADGKLASRVYDAIWSVKAALDRGAGNQIGDVLGSGYASMVFNAMARENAGTSDRAMVEHALAARAGLCDDFALTGLYLLGSAADWSGEPIFSTSIEGHRSALVGDYRMTDPLLLESWVTLPAVIPLSQSLLAGRMETPVDFTPAMPGDPRYAISHAHVQALREQFYARAPELKPNFLAKSLEQAVLGGQVWSQLSAMTEPRPVSYQLDNGEFDASSVPVQFWESTRRSLQAGNTIRAVEQYRARLQHF